MTFKSFLRYGFGSLEQAINSLVGRVGNPLLHAGALGFFLFTIVAASGLFLFAGHPSLSTPFPTADLLDGSAWRVTGLIRSLHRYSAEGLLVAAAIHGLRQFSLDRVGGPHWVGWVTGIAMLAAIYASGFSGLWLCGDPAARSLSAALPDGMNAISRDDRTLVLLLVVHLALPLCFLTVLRLHLQRVARPRCRLPARIGIIIFVMLCLLAFFCPIERVDSEQLATGFAGFFGGPLKLAILTSSGFIIALAAVGAAALFSLPWLGSRTRHRPAVVELRLCNGCGRCVDDCPANAVTLVARNDGLPFADQAAVVADRCVSCGLCVAACPTAIAFHADPALPVAIQLPRRPLAALREEIRHATALADRKTPRILVFHCERSAAALNFEVPGCAGIALPCIGMLPPSFIDYVFSRNHADGVFLAGCAFDGCRYRHGVEVQQGRIAGLRDPVLRQRVPRDRLGTFWGELGDHKLEVELRHFARHLEQIHELPEISVAAEDGVNSAEVGVTS